MKLVNVHVFVEQFIKVIGDVLSLFVSLQQEGECLSSALDRGCPVRLS